jgi:small-conductance mechanosensitive channel
MTDTVADWLNLSSRWQAQLIVSGALIVALAVLRTIVLAIVHRRIKEPSVWYRGRKLTTYTVTFVGFVMLASIWVQGSGLATYVGFLTAGLAIALSDVLKNLAGWLFIVLRRPFRVGDRVAVGEEAGDVIDVRAFRFSLQEWAPARDGAFPAYTGRIVHVPNGLLFTEPAANYSEGFKYVFHEIAVLVTFESDWRRSTSQEYRLTIDQVVPTVFTRVGDSGVEITGRLAVPYLETRAIEDAVWTDILDGFAAEPKVELAYPTVRTYFEGPVRIQGGD